MVGNEFRKSSRCGDSACVEVMRDRYWVIVRQSNLTGAGSNLKFTPDEWRAFIAGVKDGEFDLDD